MPAELVNSPVPGARAFKETSRTAALSRAAQLLLLGMDLRGDNLAPQSRSLLGAPPQHVPSEDRSDLELPEITPTGARFTHKQIQNMAPELAVQPTLEPAERRHRIGLLADTFFDAPTDGTAALLLEASLRDPDELTRVAAASSYFEITTEPHEALAILAEGTHSEEYLTADVALSALAHIAPEHPRLLELIAGRLPGTEGGLMHTSLLVHGTFARTATWWQPGGGFHTYILTTPVRGDLYAAADRFEWSGGYSDAARSIGGADLAVWLVNHAAQGVSVFAHSHGASVAMLTSHDPSITINELVLLACPVHAPKYMPNFSAVNKVVSIRVKADLVILADRGGQRFSHPQIIENVLPLWFDHSAPRDENVWRRFNVPSML